MRLTFSVISAIVTSALFTPINATAQALNYECSFAAFASPEGIEKTDNFGLEFAFDAQTEEAFILGNNGVSKVFPVRGDKSVTFLEPLSSGAVQTTTISDVGSAVHSRHTIIGNKLTPSQYYGVCEVQQ